MLNVDLHGKGYTILSELSDPILTEVLATVNRRTHGTRRLGSERYNVDFLFGFSFCFRFPFLALPLFNSFELLSWILGVPTFKRPLKLAA